MKRYLWGVLMVVIAFSLIVAGLAIACGGWGGGWGSPPWSGWGGPHGW